MKRLYYVEAEFVETVYKRKVQEVSASSEEEALQLVGKGIDIKTIKSRVVDSYQMNCEIEPRIVQGGEF